MTKKILFINFFWNEKVKHIDMRYYGIAIGSFTMGYWVDDLFNGKVYKDYQEWEKEWEEFNEYQRNKRVR